MRAGLWQLAHTPVCAQGVLQARRCAFAGAASVSSRCCASARSFYQLVAARHQRHVARAEGQRGNAVGKAVHIENFRLRP